MSNEDREKRREAAQHWAQWLNRALELAGATTATLVEVSDGGIDAATVGHWLKGDTTPSAETAVLVAKLLHQDPAVVLYAAGFEDAAVFLGSLSSDDRQQLDEMDQMIEDRLNGPDPD